MIRRLAAVVVAVITAGTLVACAEDQEVRDAAANASSGPAVCLSSTPSATPSSVGSALTAPDSVGSAAATPSSADLVRLPELVLPCLSGAGSVRLSALRGPMVINFWASWCAPCRSELPELQRFATRMAGRVSVLGVVSRDTRPAAQSLAADLGLTFPSLFDQDMALSRALGHASLPVTVVVDGEGQIFFTAAGTVDEKLLMAATRDVLGASR